jgi:hypothetical protein
MKSTSKLTIIILTFLASAIADVAFGIEKAKERTQKIAKEEITKARRPNFKGIWRQSGDTTGLGRMNSAIEIVEDSRSHWKVGHSYNLNDPPVTPNTFSYDLVSDVKISGRQLSFRVGTRNGNEPVRGHFGYSLILSEDGSRLTGHWVYTQVATNPGPGFWAARGRVPVVFIR